MTTEAHPESEKCCHGDCNQGRSCPTRQACELPVDDGELRESAKAIVWALTVAVAVLALIAVLSPFFS